MPPNSECRCSALTRSARTARTSECEASGGVGCTRVGPSPSSHARASLLQPSHAVKRFREFVVFHGEQLCPEFLVAYRRTREEDDLLLDSD